MLSPRSKHDAYGLNSHSLFTPTPLPNPTPLSDEIDDHHGDDDDIDPDLWTNLPLATPTGGGVSAKGYINSGVGVGDGSSCGSLPDPQVLEVHDPNRKSAIIAGLDMELEELTAQIDAFRMERESLTRMVAARREYRETQCYGQTSGNSSSSGSHVVRRVNDDPSVRPRLEAIDVDAVEVSKKTKSFFSFFFFFFFFLVYKKRTLPSSHVLFEHILIDLFVAFWTAI
jgi:hypothetical protein